jgi:hypothetical protein
MHLVVPFVVGCKQLKKDSCLNTALSYSEKTRDKTRWQLQAGVIGSSP